MDSARMALRLGAEKVYVIYRRTEVEMPARKEEVLHAKEEGIEFHFCKMQRKFWVMKKVKLKEWNVCVMN